MTKFDFAKANTRKFLFMPIWSGVYLLSKLTPRKKALWVFGRKGMFGDNGRYLMQYVHQYRQDIDCVWLAHSEAEKKAVSALGMKSEMVTSLQGIALAFRAAVGVVTLGLGDVNRLATGGMHVVQLWHGSPLKRIGLDSEVTFSTRRGLVGSVVGIFVRWMQQYAQGQFSLVTAPSETIKRRYETAFGVPPDRVVVTGDPKADIILNSEDQAETGVRLRAALRKHYGIGESDKIFLYAPTWRETTNLPLFPDEAVLEKLNHDLREHNAWLLVRAHYADGQGEVGNQRFDRVLAMPNVDFPDINYLLPAIDILISDYSGIIMDFSLLERPIIFYAPDLADYVGRRGLYEDYSIFTGGQWNETWASVIDDLHLCLEGQTDPFCKRALNIRNRYVEHLDTENCRRITDKILELLN